MDVLFNDTAKVSTETEAQAPQADSYSTTTRRTVSLLNEKTAEAQAPQADSYSTTTRRTVSLLNEKTATSERSIGQL